MSIFGRIKSAIFGHEAHAQTADDVAANSAAKALPSAVQSTPATASADKPSGVAVPTTAGASSPATASPATHQAVDVAPILEAAVKKSGQKLDWKHSIVDLMKALGMDASLQERKELAHELGYTGDTSDSATMNVWLHKALMKKLSENGGRVPADFLD